MAASGDVMVNEIEFLPLRTFLLSGRKREEKAISKPPYCESDTIRGTYNPILGHQARVPGEGESKLRPHLL